MTYRVDLASHKVEKQILGLPREIRNRIAQTLLKLERNPRLRNTKKLWKNIYRLRIGKYRVIYEIDDKSKVIVVTKVAKKYETLYKRID